MTSDKAILYGIPNCDTCRKARRWLDTEKIDYYFHDLRSDGLEKNHLEKWCERLGYEKILNKRSLTWRKIPEADRQNLTSGKAMNLMCANVTLIKRPILSRGTALAVGFSESGYAEIAKSG